MNKILASGSQYAVREFDTTADKLPLGIYTVMFDMDQGFYLKRQGDEFGMPEKVYNYPHALIKRWLTAWNAADKNLGILLSGEKGSGKTITAQLLCNEAKMPVIIVTAPYTNEGFKQFISNPCFCNSIIFIDEFEKIYDQEAPREDGNSVQSLLSLMDGMYDTRLLFLLTTNTSKISEFLTNRPGRVKYKTEFGFLTAEDAVEIIKDRLDNMEHEDSIYKMLDVYGNCTMDILTKVIDDMNMFDEDAMTVIKYFNMEPSPRNYDISIKLEDVVFPEAGVAYNMNFAEENYFEQIVHFSNEEVVQIMEIAMKQAVPEKRQEAYVYLSQRMRTLAMNSLTRELIRNSDGSYNYTLKYILPSNFFNGQQCLSFEWKFIPRKSFAKYMSAYAF